MIMTCYPNDPGHSACGEGPPGAGRSRFISEQNTCSLALKHSNSGSIFVSYLAEIIPIGLEVVSAQELQNFKKISSAV